MMVGGHANCGRASDQSKRWWFLGSGSVWGWLRNHA